MKQKYEEMNVTLQSILSVIGNVEQPARNKIAKHLIMKGITNQILREVRCFKNQMTGDKLLNVHQLGREGADI